MFQAIVQVYHFLVNNTDNKGRNFLKHYQQGGVLPFENRPINITRFDGLSVYSISFDEHQRFYSFYDSDDPVQNHLNVFKLRFVPTGKEVRIKCTFSIVNFQPPPADGLVELTDTRIWSTNVYSFVLFNEFVRNNLKTVIKNRLIINRLTGSSWRFRRVNYLNISVRSGKFVFQY